MFFTLKLLISKLFNLLQPLNIELVLLTFEISKFLRFIDVKLVQL